MSHLYPTPNFIAADGNKSRSVVVMGLPDGNVVPAYSFQQKKVSLGKDEKVGNFPVRMLVILVKLCKVIEYKKQLVSNLTWMNDSAEKMNLLANEYPHEFKMQYSHHNQRTDQRTCVHVKNKRVLQLITALISIILQLRAIGSNQKKRYSACEWNVLSESLNQIRSQIRAKNTAQFQDCVECT
uniref:LIN-9 C-terminal domain-containing protein n=1 Tax=Ditylenchus dipsaci TaxID=166011 RepID=A0A915DM55_9BILA